MPFESFDISDVLSATTGRLMLKIERDELSAQLATVENILSTLPENDYVGRISFEARREEIEEQLKNLRDHQTKRAQVALYFGGDSVVGSSGKEEETP